MLVVCWPSARPPAAASRSWTSGAQTSRMCSCSWLRINRLVACALEPGRERGATRGGCRACRGVVADGGIPHPAHQGDAALLEGELPDDRRTGADGGALPAGLRPGAGRPRRGVSRRELCGVPDSRAGHDVGAAERLREFIVEPDPVED